MRGKCQRRDPPCKYLHPPQHLREQLMRNGRNNMIIRNMQLQLFQQQLLAQSVDQFLFIDNYSRYAAAAAAACTSPATNSSPMAGTNTPNSNLTFPPYLNALTTSNVNGAGPAPSQISGTGSESVAPDAGITPPKRTAVADVKSGLPLYISRTNGNHTNGTSKLDNHETSTNCVMVLNGGPIDSLKETTPNGSPAGTLTLRTTTGNNLINATAATIYALQHPQNATMLNVPSHPHHQHPMAGPLAAVSLAAVVNGNMAGNGMTPAHFPTVPDHTGYFQPAYHIEIPPYPYH
ncbi:hypothetical protein CSKR_202422 [Clonorchis sinensis]|uniref:C3H1-type domain-containing protein n=1 Tax=Clonorchis sinensis TaxID=79923 RepID=A0A8T1MWP4_CLOSI|nr:hypothetical protein CSKR_202422 [Clonorchis sinensis]